MIIGARRKVERVYLADPKKYPDAPSWEVDFGDASINRIRSIIADAVKRVKWLSDEKSAKELQGDEDGARKLTEDMARLQKRVVQAFVGHDGYEQTLAWLGGGERVDPLDCVTQMGDIMAALMLMFAERAGNDRLVELGDDMRKRARRGKAGKKQKKQRR